MDMTDKILKILQHAMVLLLPSLQEVVIEYYSRPVTGVANYTLHNLYADGIRIQDSSSVSFQLKCKGDAYISLQKNQRHFEKKVLEIGIGIWNNTASTISDKHHSVLVTYMESGITSQLEYRYFWISWSDKIVRVGKGDIPYTQEFMKWHNLTHKIMYISIGTAYWTEACWKFKSETDTASTAPTYNKANDSSLVAVYISIPCVIFICMVTAVIILIFLRRRRKRARQNESVAVYSGNDLTPNRDSLPGVTNETYSSHSLKFVENSDHSNGTGYVSIVPDSHYMDICLNDEHLPEAASNETKAININY
ncbi:uncharacterized protein LOC123551295 isoform X2 [Mercenaria mercenaria]|uniref:uncharacterized protein LOC123551295 isoform X2 n=1 Tax=Mercenaria mercenaria TaxID=6596 RepID=UPI00234F3026|nr:uncharacterized protein LOC123551295 isoform X2 [Mercenaria mercenaria]